MPNCARIGQKRCTCIICGDLCGLLEHRPGCVFPRCLISEHGGDRRRLTLALSSEADVGLENAYILLSYGPRQLYAHLRRQSDGFFSWLCPGTLRQHITTPLERKCPLSRRERALRIVHRHEFQSRGLRPALQLLRNQGRKKNSNVTDQTREQREGQHRGRQEESLIFFLYIGDSWPVFNMKLNPMQKWEEQQRLKLMSKKIAGAKSVLRSRCLQRVHVLKYIHKYIVNTPDLEYLI